MTDRSTLILGGLEVVGVISVLVLAVRAWWQTRRIDPRDLKPMSLAWRANPDQHRLTRD